VYPYVDRLSLFRLLKWSCCHRRRTMCRSESNVILCTPRVIRYGVSSRQSHASTPSCVPTPDISSKHSINPPIWHAVGRSAVGECRAHKFLFFVQPIARIMPVCSFTESRVLSEVLPPFFIGRGSVCLYTSVVFNID